MGKPVIKPSNGGGSHRTGTLCVVSESIITKILGFKPNVDDDPDKVTASWSFTVDGVPCAVWDYKGSFEYGQASTYGPHEALRRVFGANYNAGL